MSHRNVYFSTGQFYHIFNKTVGGELIFDKRKVFDRAISLIDFYRYKQQMSYSHYLLMSAEQKSNNIFALDQLFPQITIFAFALMPNHFHFLLRQDEEGGVRSFASIFQNSLARYYNKKYEREGKLFKELFKAVLIESDEELLHVSRYIHLNRITSSLGDKTTILYDPYTSYQSYMGNNIYPFVNTEMILSHFENKAKYAEFILNQADYQKKLYELRHVSID